MSSPLEASSLHQIFYKALRSGQPKPPKRPNHVISEQSWVGMVISTHHWLLTPELSMTKGKLSGQFQLITRGAGRTFRSRDIKRASKFDVVKVLV